MTIQRMWGLRRSLAVGFLGAVTLAGCRVEGGPADSTGGTTSGMRGAASATAGTSWSAGGVESTGSTGGSAEAGAGAGGAASGTGGAAIATGGSASSTGGVESTGSTGGSAGVGGTTAGTGGAAEATGGTASSAGGIASAGGEGGVGEAGSDFPWPELPTARGTVTDVEPGDLSAAGCCTRVPGEDNYDAGVCKPGVLTYEHQDVVDDPEAGQHLTFFGGTHGSFTMIVVGRFPGAKRLGAIVTEIPPPEGIIDLSPVFWVGTESGELAEGGIAVSITKTNYGGESLGPGGVVLPVYYSADGVEFEALDSMGTTLIGPTAVLRQPGFVVAGIGPDLIECHGP